MDLESCKHRKDDRKDHQIAFHHPRKDICVIFNKRGSYNMREDLNGDDLTCHCRQKEQQCRKSWCQSFPYRHKYKSPYKQKLFLLQFMSKRKSFLTLWCSETESNCRHGDFQSPALPTELSEQELGRTPLDVRPNVNGDAEGARTLDLQRDRLAF